MPQKSSPAVRRMHNNSKRALNRVRFMYREKDLLPKCSKLPGNIVKQKNMISLPHRYKRGEGVSRVVVAHHIHLNASHADRTFHAQRQVVGIIAHPNGHFLATGKHGALHQQGLEFYRMKFAVFGLDGFLAEITHVEVVSLVVEKHGKRDLITFLEVVEI